MARKIKLTDGRIGKLKAEDVEYMVWDTRIAGFGVRVRPTGHKSYVYHRHAEGQSRKFTLGPVALGSVDEARRDCMEVWGRIQSGERAEDTNGAQAPLFQEFVTGSWRAACYEPCKQSTKTSKAWALNNQLLPAFGAMPLDRIDRTGVIRWFEDYSVRAPGGANSALLVFRQIMNHAISRGHIETNPTVPSIYSIVPPNDGSALRHGLHFEPVDFVIDHGRGHHDAYSAGSCQRTYARACGCRQRPRRHREELIESERGRSGREAFVTMMQTADLGQGNDRTGPGRLNGSTIRCVLADRQVGP